MSRHESSRGPAEAAELLFEVRDQLFDERAATGAIVRGVGKDMMAQPARGIENHINHLGPGHFGILATRRLQRSKVIAAEAGYLVNDRIAPCGLRRIRLGKNNPRAEMYRALMKGTQQLALDIHELHALRLVEATRLVNLIDQ